MAQPEELVSGELWTGAGVKQVAIVGDMSTADYEAGVGARVTYGH